MKADPTLSKPNSTNTVPIVADLTCNSGPTLRGSRTASKKLAESPISIYEVHLGSGAVSGRPHRWITTAKLAEQLIPYVKQIGYTISKLLPIMEHPSMAAWGEQTLGYYALPAGRLAR